MVPVWSRQVGQGVSDRRAFNKKPGKATSSVPVGSTLELESLVCSMDRATSAEEGHPQANLDSGQVQLWRQVSE